MKLRNAPMTDARCSSCHVTAWEVPSRSRPGVKHTVRYSISNHKHPELGPGYSCTCEAYKYREGNCWHIKLVLQSYCGWNQRLDGGEPIDGCCPWCGEEVEE